MNLEQLMFAVALRAEFQEYLKEFSLAEVPGRRYYWLPRSEVYAYKNPSFKGLSYPPSYPLGDPP